MSRADLFYLEMQERLFHKRDLTVPTTLNLHTVKSHSVWYRIFIVAIKDPLSYLLAYFREKNNIYKNPGAFF